RRAMSSVRMRMMFGRSAAAAAEPAANKMTAIRVGTKCLRIVTCTGKRRAGVMIAYRLMMHLLVAHPGHELLLHGWIARNKPVVHVLTDGTRLGRTAELLRGLGARSGAIFGRLSDAEAYAMILKRNTALLVSLVAELAAQLEGDQPAIIVGDAAEGYNPVHDLCRLIAGAAIAMAGVPTKQYEYAVVNHPHSSDAASIVVELDAAEYAAKMERVRGQAAALADIDELLSR